MRRNIFCIIFISLVVSFYAQSVVKPLYQLSTVEQNQLLVGSGSGLYRVDSNISITPLWTGDKVLKIEKTNEGYFLLTGKGIIFSKDLKTFEERNTGLQFLTIKKYDGITCTTQKQVTILKDLAINPQNPQEMVTASKDCVYISHNSGKEWTSLGSMSRDTAGMKAVAIATIENNTVVFMSHPIFGLAYCIVSSSSPVWHDVTGGFEAMPSQTYPDEISDILPVVKTNETGETFVEIYLCQAYIPRIYRFDWKTKRGQKIYSGKEKADTFDAMTIINNTLLFTSPNAICAIDTETKLPIELTTEQIKWQKSLQGVPSPVYCAYVPKKISGFEKDISYSELWLLTPGSIVGSFTQKATDKKAIYIPAHQVFTDKGIERYRKLIKDNKLNALVIDMKDDYGLIHYHTTDELIKQKGKESRWALDIENFIDKFKTTDSVYLIARIVTFKDPNLAKIENGKYAVWNKKTSAPWVGTRRITNTTTNEDGTKVQNSYIGFYDEQWVDPYSNEVWEYDVAIAQELVRLGFDEVQFDYIRFPTDGLNLSDATFRHISPGMDKESALISFLSYARENINAPIGIDIYGANGWYRSGTRTGQDVELLSEYVDVICPMFYPSHFENGFLNYEPWSERPYRIYYYGTYRNTVMGRNSIIVRPWVQAFYMNVPYDRQFYDKNYVRREIFGVRDSVDRGYMYWNNAGNYEENLLPDIEDAIYPWSAIEATSNYRKPALGPKILEESKTPLPDKSTTEDEEEKAKLHILETIKHQRKNEGESFLDVSIEVQNTKGVTTLQKIRDAWSKLGESM